jgi:hypothetical protein
MRVKLPRHLDGEPSACLGGGEPAQRKIQATSWLIRIDVAQLGSVGHVERDHRSFRAAARRRVACVPCTEFVPNTTQLISRRSPDAFRARDWIYAGVEAASIQSRPFGSFAAPDRRLVFGPNDFDETLPGPWEWDVKRMAASAEIAGRDVGLPADRRRWIVTECVREYREGMRDFANESHLDVWYDRLTASELVDRFGGRLGEKGRIVFAKPFAKARRKTSLRAVKKLTERVDGELRFRSVPPLLVPLRELFDPGDPRDESAYVRELLDEYAASLDVDRRYLFGTYRFVDMARKVVGVGSVGTRAWVVPARRP